MKWNFSIRLAIRMTYTYGWPRKGEIGRAPIADVIVISLPCLVGRDNDAKGVCVFVYGAHLFPDGIGM